MLRWRCEFPRTIEGGAQRVAAEHGLIIVAPDTSPRGLGLPGEGDDWDFGSGSGFYIDATAEPFSGHYRMNSYVTAELPALVEDPRGGKLPRSGGRMGHLWALDGRPRRSHHCPQESRPLQKRLRLHPIAAPTRAPWGKKAFSGYLGPGEEWRGHDASELVSERPFPDGRTIIVDQGTADQFLEEQLYPEVFQAACAEAGQPLTLRWCEGYDHGYYFISTFMEDHIEHHAEALNAS